MRRAPPAPSDSLKAAFSDDEKRLALEGALDVHTLADGDALLERWLRSDGPHALDLAGLRTLDTTGALLLHRARGRGVELSGVRDEHRALLDLIGGLEHDALPVARPVAGWRHMVMRLGKGAADARHDTIDVVTFIGRSAGAIGRALVHPRELRFASLSRHVAETGVEALPIVALMAVMISVVLGYQSVAGLRVYGSQDLTINLVAVSMLREMGVLITAIMVAGRSGCAFTAEIGVMKARGEIDALEVMGLRPIQMLVVPRLIAIVVTLPLLTFFADVMGLLGGALIAQTLLGVSLLQYVDRVHHAVDVQDFLVGLIKAPVFAFLIGVIGCMHGLRVRGSAESVGREATRAVVKAIFVVIVLDALFSVLFERLGV
jgi:phospholipid/cholesterol/gamma-HCH transport system permease protein